MSTAAQARTNPVPPIPGRRFLNVNYQEILSGRKPPPPMPAKATTTATSNIPEEKYTNSEYQLLHLRATSMPTQLRSRERKVVYAPTITGTIFSLEYHAQTHPRIHRWTQEAIPSTQGGWITFYDDPTVRSKGVFYI